MAQLHVVRTLRFISFTYFISAGDEDVARLLERWTGTPRTQVRFSGGAGDFFSLRESNLSADSLTESVHLRVQLHALTYVRTLKMP